MGRIAALLIMFAAIFMCSTASAQFTSQVGEDTYIYFGSSDAIPLIELGCPGEVIIGDSPGGNLTGTVATIGEAFICETVITIAGECYSGCTMFLTLPPEQLCFTDDALFFFHGPGLDVERYEALYGEPPTEEIIERDRIRAVNFMLGIYPAWIRPWIEQNGALNSNDQWSSISSDGVIEIGPDFNQVCRTKRF